MAATVSVACAHGVDVDVGEGEDSVRVRPEDLDRVEDAVDAEDTVRLLAPDGAELGDADLSRTGELWRVEVEVTPPEGASGWRGFVIGGDCRKESGRVVQLSPFAADESGFESVTSFPRAWLKPDTPYAVVILDGDGARAACGEIGEP